MNSRPDPKHASSPPRGTRLHTSAAFWLDVSASTKSLFCDCWGSEEVRKGVAMSEQLADLPTLPEAMPPVARPDHYKWSVVAMLWFICFLNYGDRQAISAIFPKLHDEFNFDTVQLGLIGS